MSNIDNNDFQSVIYSYIFICLAKLLIATSLDLLSMINLYRVLPVDFNDYY